MIRPVEVCHHLLHFRLGKAESTRIIQTENRFDCKIIQPGKNAFFADSKAACDYTSFKIRISLECRFKERTNEINHLIVKAFEICIFKRHIVLVDEDDCVFSVVLPQAFR